MGFFLTAATGPGADELTKGRRRGPTIGRSHSIGNYPSLHCGRQKAVRSFFCVCLCVCRCSRSVCVAVLVFFFSPDFWLGLTLLSGLDWVSTGLSQVVLLGCTGFYLVVLDCTWLYWVVLFFLLVLSFLLVERTFLVCCLFSHLSLGFTGFY